MPRRSSRGNRPNYAALAGRRTRVQRGLPTNFATTPPGSPQAYVQSASQTPAEGEVMPEEAAAASSSSSSSSSSPAAPPAAPAQGGDGDDQGGIPDDSSSSSSSSPAAPPAAPAQGGDGDDQGGIPDEEADVSLPMIGLSIDGDDDIDPNAVEGDGEDPGAFVVKYCPKCRYPSNVGGTWGKHKSKASKKWCTMADGDGSKYVGPMTFGE